MVYPQCMRATPVSIDAMGWVDVAQAVYLRGWLGETTKPASFKSNFQVAECLVDGARVLVVLAHPPAPPEAQRAALQILRGHYGPEALVSLVEAHGEGWSRQSSLTPANDPEARRAIAMASAVVQTNWGWDESAEIRVEDSAGCVIARPTNRAGAWTATASEASGPTAASP